MDLGLNLGYSGSSIGEVLPLVTHADRVGLDSVWAAEAYGSDVVTVLSYLAARTERIKVGSAVMQMPARTPANTAMTAMTLDHLSGGRLLLGLGLSGPQVVEGWHGVPYGKPLGRTREYVEIVRKAIAREEPLSHEGTHYEIPYRGADATGLGKPLKSILHPLRPTIPIYLAAVGPRNTALAAEIADGWLPIFYSPEREAILTEHLDAGLAAAGRDPADLDIAATVYAAAGDDVQACRDRLKPMLALYVGGMGSRDKNFYKDLMVRYGYEAAAQRIQDHYLAGHKAEAAAAVPDELVDEIALVGPLDRIVDRLAAWRESRVGTLILGTQQPEILEPIRDALG
ncbi:LLM class F420-dependent oxidoreductase [Egibacter rhizosphaerae]|uniref:LLM class F420-dependent oxidoreductase n=1 Tax=Egibacter rhizosphaerae TaxID=1670831 RepID=A0A411YI75_9ACTN|nr:LLM class F420-dependent oxidoreductase [Egibacter rhizosphaerae]QBI21015.1 LLM class F420-dependent oxidoreductase [Egibacter rhizosphaerae]